MKYQWNFLLSPSPAKKKLSSVHGILQARMLKWVAISHSRGSSRSRDQTHTPYVSCLAGRFFTTEPLGKPTILMTIHRKQSSSALFLTTNWYIIVVFLNWVIWKCNTEFNIIPVDWCINFYAFFVPFYLYIFIFFFVGVRECGEVWKWFLSDHVELPQFNVKCFWLPVWVFVPF